MNQRLSSGPSLHTQKCSRAILHLDVDAQENRIAIYELLFKEGVMVAKKDVHMSKHPELVDKNVPNLHIVYQS